MHCITVFCRCSTQYSFQLRAFWCILIKKSLYLTHTHLFNGPFSGTTRVSQYQKGKPIWILLKQETVSDSGISWAICKSATRSRQITMPAPHHSVFYRPDALPVAQPTASKHWRHVFDVFVYLFSTKTAWQLVNRKADFLQNKSIQIDSHNKSNWIDSNRVLECSTIRVSWYYSRRNIHPLTAKRKKKKDLQKIHCMGAHLLYGALSQQGLLDTIKSAYNQSRPDSQLKN